LIGGDGWYSFCCIGGNAGIFIASFKLSDDLATCSIRLGETGYCRLPTLRAGDNLSGERDEWRLFCDEFGDEMYLGLPVSGFGAIEG
jgi:hypothetical protein